MHTSSKLLRNLSCWCRHITLANIFDKRLSVKKFSSYNLKNMESPLFCEGNIQIYGKCVKEYEPVKDAFIQNFVSGQELNASICVYVKEKCVIDLYGTSNNDSSYNSKSLQVMDLSEIS